MPNKEAAREYKKHKGCTYLSKKGENWCLVYSVMGRPGRAVMTWGKNSTRLNKGWEPGGNGEKVGQKKKKGE